MIVVSGGAGFLGSHLIDNLLKSGDRVLCFDDLSTGTIDNFEHLEQAPLKVIEHDVRDPMRVDDPVSAIYHLACPASPAQYLKDGVRTIESAFLGTRNALILATEHECPLVITSTSEVYGDPAVHPQREDYTGNVDITQRRSAYKEGKRAAETLALAWGEQHDVDVRIARIFNTYGPRMAPNDGRLVSTLLRQAIAGEPMTIHGSGQQTRSFCYVDDTVRGLVALMRSSSILDLDRRSRIVNIGNPEERNITSVAVDVASLIVRTLQQNTRIQYLPSSEEETGEDPRRRCPDITRARELLGWEPKVTWEDGLAFTAGWFLAQTSKKS